MEIYIHIPFCERKCNYCDFLSGISTKEDRYLYTKALERELILCGEKYKDKEITSVFIGGGTPTYLEVSYMLEIIETLKKNFKLRSDLEFTIECNPKSATLDALKKYRQSGINRISIGLQSVNFDELKMLGRIHTYNDFLKTFEYARIAGFSNINVDIMTGLPMQNEKKLKKTLESVVMLRPEHISAYNLIIEEGTPFFKKYIDDVKRRDRGDETRFLPNEDMEYNLTLMTEDFLISHRYIQYEISNFSREGKECIHNKGYWEREEYLGVGLGASSFINETRWKNTSDAYKYRESLSHDKLPKEDEVKLSKKDAMEEFFYLGLREIRGVSRNKFESYFNMTVDSVYRDVINDLKNKKLIIEDKASIRLTKRGRNISNLVLAEFLLD